MLTSSDKLIYRHFNVENDFALLVTLLTAVEQADQDGVDVSEASLRDQLTVSGYDPDRWVVTTNDSVHIIGYGVVFKTPNDNHADIHIAIHPEWRRQGIGSELLTQIMAYAHELHAHDLCAYAAKQHQGATNFLLKHEFHPISGYTRMMVSGTQSFPLPNVPAGFVIRNYDQLRRMDLVVEALNRSYHGLWGHHQIGQEGTVWLSQVNPEGIFLLFAPDGMVAGFCRCDLNEHLTKLRGNPTGRIDAPGVVPEHRNTNLYQSLVLTALQWLVPQDPVTIELESWGDTDTTLDIYRTLGFTAVQEEISYRRFLE